jgi:hypothetical protein
VQLFTSFPDLSEGINISCQITPNILAETNASVFLLLVLAGVGIVYIEQKGE